MQCIHNPILEGFNPDPSIIKIKGKYYIGVSTFEWLPGIRVYESEDLVNWSYCTSILTKNVLSDLKGHPKGGSIWAPQISYADHTFYLVYTDVKSTKVPFKDVDNYLIKANDIKGPWSKPVYLNSSGFDPCLFHADDGKMWLLNEIWDYRITTRNRSAGIVLQEFDGSKLVGEIYKIFAGTMHKKTEAPQLYKYGKYYYLLTAEGGTEEGHMVTVARSEQITGPYTVDPQNPMLTSFDDSSLILQCSGHASLVETDEQEWYLAHLCTRPVLGKYPILGRETALQKVKWSEDGWLRLSHGGHSPATNVELPKEFDGTINCKDNAFFDGFDTNELNTEWNTLRIFPDASWLKIDSKKSILRMVGGESPQSVFEQHMIAVRQKNINFYAETEITFDPQSYLQLAGIILYLDIMNYIYLYISYDEKMGRVVQIMKAAKDDFTILPIKMPIHGGKIKLCIAVKGVQGEFMIEDQGEKVLIAEENISFLSGGFTGNFIGLMVNDLEKKNHCMADFSYFTYQPSKNSSEK